MSFPVTNLARSRAFYEGRLGLEVVREAGPYVFLRAGSSQLALVARPTVTPPATADLPSALRSRIRRG